MPLVGSTCLLTFGRDAKVPLCELNFDFTWLENHFSNKMNRRSMGVAGVRMQSVQK